MDHITPGRWILIGLFSLVIILLVVFMGCNGTSGAERNDLAAMETARISIKGQQIQIDAWLANTSELRTLGLMQVTEKELAPINDTSGQFAQEILRGMLFVFPSEQPLGFWMRNTITPLDIAYIRRDGVIVNTYTMAPQETRIYPSIEPAIFALEVKAGTFARLGIRTGDQVEIPNSVLKNNP